MVIEALVFALSTGIERVALAAAIDHLVLADVTAGVEVYALGCTTDTKDMSINRQLSFWHRDNNRAVVLIDDKQRG